MSSSSFWSDACASAQSKPVQTQLDATYASCGTTVRRQSDSGLSALLLLLLLLMVVVVVVVALMMLLQHCISHVGLQRAV